MNSSKSAQGEESWLNVEGHKELPQVLEPLVREENVAELKPHLVALEMHLTAHFKEEEQPGGWFEELLQQQPGNAPRLNELRDEHAEILKQVDALIGKINVLQAQVVVVESEKKKLLDLVKHHCDAEHQLALDSYYTDTGGG